MKKTLEWMSSPMEWTCAAGMNEAARVSVLCACIHVGVIVPERMTRHHVRPVGQAGTTARRRLDVDDASGLVACFSITRMRSLFNTASLELRCNR